MRFPLSSTHALSTSMASTSFAGRLILFVIHRPPSAHRGTFFFFFADFFNSNNSNILSSHTRQRGLDAYALARRGQGTLDGYRTHVGDARRDARFYADGLRSDSHVFRDLYGLAPEEVLVLGM